MNLIAIKILISDRIKLFTALLGVIFTIILINIQCGLFLGLIYKTSLLVDCGQADIWVGHKLMHNVDLPSDIDKDYINRIKSVKGIKSVSPYLIGVTEIILKSGKYENVCVIGVDRKTLIGAPWNIVEGKLDNNFRSDGIFIDQSELTKLENLKIGDSVEIGKSKTTVIGITNWITGFLVMPYIFMTHEQASICLGKRSDITSYILIQLEDYINTDYIISILKQRLPNLEILTKIEYSNISTNYWMKRTGLGISFGASTLLGLVIGIIIVGQILYTFVLDRLDDFATLKAIGASELQIYSILFIFGLFLSLLGSIIGLFFVFVIQLCFSTPLTLIIIPWKVSLCSFLLITLMCFIASLLPYYHIHKTDPVIILK